MSNHETTSKRVVITAMGIISSLGKTPEEILASIKEDRTSFTLPPFDQKMVVAPVENFDLRNFTGPFKDRRYLNRGAQLSVAAAISALRNSNLDEETAATAGLFVGSGPNFDIGGELPGIHAGEIVEESLMALWILRFLPNTAASTIARLTGMHGENLTVATACTATLQAIGEAFRKIKDGHLNLALAGGGDSRNNPGGILAYRKANALFTGGDDPQAASRPFDKKRKGFVPGEGGAFFLLEEREHARKRGAMIYGEICGFGASMDGYSMTAPDPDGRWEEAAVRAALAEAGMSPADIAVVAAHGTGTALNDAMEAELLARIWGEGRTPRVIALKSWIGHLSVACGAVELGICLTLMNRGCLPRIRNLEEPCRDGINFVRREEPVSLKTLLVENFGFGGQNSALIVKAHDGA
ncbi:MAG: beta-ketoacyl-[acyl-carrier-protein] synthase family protein [Deltaproteobacteria bacterium]|nr:beta-ketoacyl-[acyl-carrier-protein] synthase family protein [Deltaproteobacteria bacterium]